MRYEDLQRALDIFCLPERATLKEIKARHRALVKRCHPDTGGIDTERIREINEAYRVLNAYCGAYQFSFSRAEFLRQNPDEWFRHQFGKDPIWGG